MSRSVRALRQFKTRWMFRRAGCGQLTRPPMPHAPPKRDATRHRLNCSSDLAYDLSECELGSMHFLTTAFKSSHARIHIGIELASRRTPSPLSHTTKHASLATHRTPRRHTEAHRGTPRMQGCTQIAGEDGHIRQAHSHTRSGQTSGQQASPHTHRSRGSWRAWRGQATAQRLELPRMPRHGPHTHAKRRQPAFGARPAQSRRPRITWAG
jgi:hypothetical protein